MEERIRAEFLEILKRVLSDLHQKKYKNILKYVDTQDDFDLLDFLENDLEDTLEDYGYEALDEYGTLVDEDDKIERLDIYEFNDGTGFSIDYFLSNAIQLSIISVVFCHREPLFFMPKNFKNITKNS